MRVELQRTEETIEELKHTHTKDIKDFETLATQWEVKEQNYKSEMKKLEVLLSKTDGGLEKVSLARSKSTVHGAQRVGESIKRDIGTIKARHAARSSRGWFLLALEQHCLTRNRTFGCAWRCSY